MHLKVCEKKIGAQREAFKRWKHTFTLRICLNATKHSHFKIYKRFKCCFVCSLHKKQLFLFCVQSITKKMMQIFEQSNRKTVANKTIT